MYNFSKLTYSQSSVSLIAFGKMAQISDMDHIFFYFLQNETLTLIIFKFQQTRCKVEPEFKLEKRDRFEIVISTRQPLKPATGLKPGNGTQYKTSIIRLSIL